MYGKRLIIGSAIAVASAQTPYTFADGQKFLKTYCLVCHQGESAQAGFRMDRISAEASLRAESRRWTKSALRVRNGEMPPKGAPEPSLDQREQFGAWAENAVRQAVCSSGIVAGPAVSRRLNRYEYSATLRDLLDMHLDIGSTLPADGAGGEGFDNAAETLFLSPLHSEKYMAAAKFAMDFAAREHKSRAKIFVARPGAGLSESQAARKIFENFLPRAFRRPVAGADIAPYLSLYQAFRKQGEPFEPAILFALRAAIVSPNFLFRVEPPNRGSAIQPLDQYALASRLSYFLWGSMPDELLFDAAKAGKLHDEEVLRQLVRRMVRNDRALVFAQRFVEQWLHTRDLGGEKVPDAKLFPEYAASEELRSDMRFQPIQFLHELIMRNLSVLNLIDSKYTIGTRNLARHFGLQLPLNPGRTAQPQWVELPEGSQRGGLLGMPAVLAVSSYPYRTSPVLRGAWILENMLGTPPPPPPPDVTDLEEPAPGDPHLTVRERLTRHRANPSCAGCHSRIDPLGFPLENYDVIGRWRTEEGGKPVDNTAELADGTKLSGPAGLKKVLLDRKDLFIRHLTNKMLGYALGRGLMLEDSCTVDAIIAELRQNDYSARTLVEAIVLSVPFRSQAPRPAVPAKESTTP
ncbi:MAG: DUF1592 domain-containing protein [Bryobacteraceae bacterium]